MPDMHLHRNGRPCPACEMRREAEDKSRVMRPAVPCNRCGGIGRVPRPVTEIVAEHAAEARRAYWPEREKRWRNA